MLWSLAQILLILLISFRQGDAFPRNFGRKIAGLNVSASEVEHLLQSRQILSNSLGGLVGLIPTTIELPPAVVIGRKRIPDDDHPFIAPGPTDVRGGCPGLNILANYGYISRDGITTVTELLWALQEMLGTAVDLAVVLVFLGLKTSVDLTTLKMSIGDTDTRTDGPLSGLFGTAAGLFSPETHNKFELDGSFAQVDAYFANGQTNHFSSQRWRKYRQVAIDRFGGVMNTKWNGLVKFMQYNECRYHNPECNWDVLDQLALYAADAFVSTMMASADEQGNPLPPDVKSIDIFFGFIENPDGSFTRGHSKLPPGPDGHWYRRAVPNTFEQQLTTWTDSILAYPVEFGRNNGTIGFWEPSLTQLPNLVKLNLPCYLLQQTRDRKDPRYAKHPAVGAAVGKLLANTIRPVLDQLACP